MFNIFTIALIFLLIAIWLFKTHSALIILIILELITILSITLIIKTSTSLDLTILMILLTFAALEATAGLSILVSFTRSFGTDRIDNKKIIIC